MVSRKRDEVCAQGGCLITLKTGVPGSGKSLTVVQELMALRAKEARAEFRESPRNVFVHGIPELAVLHSVLPVYSCAVRGRDGGYSRSLEVEWDDIPSGALVIVDEAQHLFPVRGAGTRIPGYVAWLNTHRHRGFDLVLITQHPTLIDSAVRKLAGKHQHYRRLFGGQRHMRYEWDYCSDRLGFKDATMRPAEFPKRAKSAYLSAEIHTKQKFGVPIWVVVPVLAIIGGIFVIPRAVLVMGGAMTGKGITPQSAQASASAPHVSSPGVQRAAGTVGAESEPGKVSPPLGALPGLAVAVNAVARRNTWPAAIAGCIAFEGGCMCATNEARPRLLQDLGTLCTSIASGELGPDPARPVPVRVESTAAELPPFAASAPGAPRSQALVG